MGLTVFSPQASTRDVSDASFHARDVMHCIAEALTPYMAYMHDGSNISSTWNASAIDKYDR